MWARITQLLQCSFTILYLETFIDYKVSSLLSEIAVVASEGDQSLWNGSYKYMYVSKVTYMSHSSMSLVQEASTGGNYVSYGDMV